MKTSTKSISLACFMLVGYLSLSAPAYANLLTHCVADSGGGNPGYPTWSTHNNMGSITSSGCTGWLFTGYPYWSHQSLWAKNSAHPRVMLDDGSIADYVSIFVATTGGRSAYSDPLRCPGYGNYRVLSQYSDFEETSLSGDIYNQGLSLSANRKMWSLPPHSPGMVDLGWIWAATLSGFEFDDGIKFLVKIASCYCSLI